MVKEYSSSKITTRGSPTDRYRKPFKRFSEAMAVSIVKLLGKYLVHQEGYQLEQ